VQFFSGDAKGMQRTSARRERNVRGNGCGWGGVEEKSFVQEIFKPYVEHISVTTLFKELNERVLRIKQWQTRTGKQKKGGEGQPFAAGNK
jgi:hypothetical protein